MSNRRIKPGQTAPASAQYRPARGGNEITLPKGHTAPPTPRRGDAWVIVDRTRNKSGRG